MALALSSWIITAAWPLILQRQKGQVWLSECWGSGEGKDQGLPVPHQVPWDYRGLYPQQSDVGRTDRGREMETERRNYEERKTERHAGQKGGAGPEPERAAVLCRSQLHSSDAMG